LSKNWRRREVERVKTFDEVVEPLGIERITSDEIHSSSQSIVAVSPSRQSSVRKWKSGGKGDEGYKGDD
jgi:hypothetical protein